MSSFYLISQYFPSGRYTWEDLVRNFAIFYNFDQTLDGGVGWGDKIQLFASEEKFGFQFQELQV